MRGVAPRGPQRRSPGTCMPAPLMNGVSYPSSFNAMGPASVTIASCGAKTGSRLRLGCAVMATGMAKCEGPRAELQ